MDMNRRKELQEAFKKIKTNMGIYKITNSLNGKIYIDSYPNLKNKWLTLQMQLNMGKFANSQLQKEWTNLGAEAFTYEVLEEKEADKIIDRRWELKKMKNKWLEKLQPYGDRGYNKLAKE